ncbi:MAG TPA: hypothetical protein VES39_05545 [Rhodospirillales bacterium]|nr:hypothetical protein [Rhodospirillales bacterium]
MTWVPRVTASIAAAVLPASVSTLLMVSVPPGGAQGQTVAAAAEINLRAGQRAGYGDDVAAGSTDDRGSVVDCRRDGTISKKKRRHF